MESYTKLTAGFWHRTGAVLFEALVVEQRVRKEALASSEYVNETLLHVSFYTANIRQILRGGY